MPGRFSPRLSALLRDLTVVHLKGDRWKSTVYNVLGINPKNDPKDRPLVLESILTYVSAQLGGKTIVIEPYTSTDWADEYQAWYSRIFRDYPRQTLRLHFFKSINSKKTYLQRADLLNLPEECLLGHGSAYLGYCVIRPFIPATVAETVLAPPNEHSKGIHVHCVAQFKTHLLGHELTVRGMPFIEQEQAVSVCAEADLWMVSRYMHANNNSRRFRPSEMAKKANQTMILGATRDGLIVRQMFNALKAMEFNADLSSPFAKEPSDFLQLIYTCVKSEIPVIVAIPHHVLTIVGYRYGKTPNNVGAGDSISRYVKSFIVHDDQIGPYREMTVAKRKARDRKTKLSFEFLTLNSQAVEQCIWILPDRVHLREPDVRILFDEWITQGKLSDLTEKKWDKSEFKDLETCCYLRKSTDFKRDLFPTKLKRDDQVLREEDLIAFYWKCSLPKYIWVVELSESHTTTDFDPTKRKLVGEILFDATAHWKDVYNSLLAVHLRGKLLIRANKTSFSARHKNHQTVESSNLMGDSRNWEYYFDVNKTPYSPMWR